MSDYETTVMRGDAAVPRSRLATCVHEAGHAVVAHYCWRSIRENGIAVFDDVDRQGYCHTRSARESVDQWASATARMTWKDGARVVWQHVSFDSMVLLAGSLAEKKHRGIRNPHFWPGFGGPDDKGSDCANLRLIAAAQEPGRADEFFYMLLETFRPYTMRVLRHPRAARAVDDVAKALDAKGHLDADAFERIIQPIKPPRSRAGLLFAA